jgi:hypothetical protein
MTARLNAAVVAVCTVAAATTAPVAGAGRITLNDTGMTQCIDHHKQWSSECLKSYQDAAYGRDVDNANPEDGEAGFSFRKVCRSGEMAGEGSCPSDPLQGSGSDDWGCVYDNVSQLTWEAKTDDGSMHSYRLQFTNKGNKARDDFSDAAWLVDATNAQALCGATSWRLPDVSELQSIVDYGQGVPNPISSSFVDPTFFPYAWGSWTWTRSDYVYDSKLAWYVDFDDGGINFRQRFDSGASARLVHGAPKNIETRQAMVRERFSPSDDGTEILDILTGLIWSRCSVGMVWNSQFSTCDGKPHEFTRVQALDYARVNKAGGWRLPNIKELFSIVDTNVQPPPAIDHLAFPNTPSSVVFFSSTPVDSVGLYWETVSFFKGTIGESSEGNRNLLRMVRRGRQ